MKIKLLLLTLLFFTKFSFAQNYVSYSSKSGTITTNSDVEGFIDIVISCYGNSSSPVILNQHFLCGDPDGFVSNLASNGLSLIPGQTTTIKFKFKKNVSVDTQKVYKFTTNGSCFQNESEMIKITVNYKVGNVVPPTDPSKNPYFIKTTYADQDEIYEGQFEAITVWGWWNLESDSYEWEKRVGSGNWETIPGQTNFSIQLYNISQTTFFRRKTYNSLGSYLGVSNELRIFVWPKLLNNVINISGSEVQGSFPTGGTGSYEYSWYVYALADEDPWLYQDNTRNFTVPENVYNFIGSNNAYIRRTVRSGNQISTSNAVVVTPAQDITNNTITIEGKNITGSLPTGGNGDFRYEYYSYLELPDGEIEAPSMVGSDEHYMVGINTPPVIKYYRRVVSANKSSLSNVVSFPLSKSFAYKESLLENNISDLTVYPNPTSESVNFSTNFSTNKEIEIILYSEKTRNEKSVFKGTVTPNQVVNWNIPSSYQKGLYFYKILSGSKEVKTGKIIVQ